jgi:hypothetical protein
MNYQEGGWSRWGVRKGAESCPRYLTPIAAEYGAQQHSVLGTSNDGWSGHPSCHRESIIATPIESVLYTHETSVVPTSLEPHFEPTDVGQVSAERLDTRRQRLTQLEATVEERQVDERIQQLEPYTSQASSLHLA